MTEQRQRAKADAVACKAGVTPLTAYREVMEAAGQTEFTGYDQWESEGRVKGLLRDGQTVTSAAAGQTVEVVLDRSPSTPRRAGSSVITAPSAWMTEPCCTWTTSRCRYPGCGCIAPACSRVRQRSALRRWGSSTWSVAGRSPGAHGHAHDPQDVPRDVKATPPPRWLGERTGPIAVRLPVPESGPGLFCATPRNA